MPATIRMYANGLTMGVAGHNPLPTKRGAITGWSASAVRRHTRWLYSIDAPALESSGEVGYALTLTLRHCPPTHDAWQRVRNAWLERMRVAGAVRVHWVVEWQRRGVPHLHAAVYFPSAYVETTDGSPSRRSQAVPGGVFAAIAWMQAAATYDAAPQAQHYDTISGALGWLKYLSKHAARGVRHYQRNGKPEGWEKTGRLWGHTGSWPEIPPIEWSGTMQDYHRFRRLIRSWRTADARSSGDPQRIAYARRMLACPDRRLSAVRGVSDWVPEGVSTALAGLVMDRRSPAPG